MADQNRIDPTPAMIQAGVDAIYNVMRNPQGQRGTDLMAAAAYRAMEAQRRADIAEDDTFDRVHARASAEVG